MKVDLSQLRQWLHTDPKWGQPKMPKVTGISINSRTIKPGEVFFALRGPSFDGHQFVKQAVAAGASAVVVESPMDVGVPTFIVRDSRDALGQFASAYRQQFELPIVAITGSCGKTTVREMTAAILRQCGSVHVTFGNRNNTVGVPITLLDLCADHDYAVLEMGTNELGEIARISSWAKPSVAVITNIAPAHLVGLVNVETILSEKSKIFASLPMNGTGIFSGLSPHVPYWRKYLKGIQQLTFGDESCDVYATHVCLADEYSEFNLVTPSDKIAIKLNIAGRHHVTNALTAASCAVALNISSTHIKAGLEQFEAVAGRFRILHGINDIRLIDDSYNANFHSVNAALQQLARYQGQRIFVFGDMGELGEQAVYYHKRVGEVARELGINRLLTVGDLTQHTAAAYGSAAEHYAVIEELLVNLKQGLDKQCTVLVKGSNAAGMGRVVSDLQV